MMNSSQTLVISNDDVMEDNNYNNNNNNNINDNNMNNSNHERSISQNNSNNNNNNVKVKLNNKEKKSRFINSPKAIQRKLREELDEEMDYEQVSDYLDRGVYSDASEKSGTVMLLSEIVNSASTYNIIHHLQDNGGNYSLNQIYMLTYAYIYKYKYKYFCIYYMFFL